MNYPGIYAVIKESKKFRDKKILRDTVYSSELIDISVLGRQSEWEIGEALSIFYEGFIINIKEITAELSMPKTDKSIEVIEKVYREMGLDKLSGVLDGFFNMILIDHEKKQIYLINDRHGARPFYWMEQNGDFYLASNPRFFLLAKDKAFEFNEQALGQYLKFLHPFDEDTLLQGVKRYPPGTITRWGQNGCMQRTYFQYKFERPDGRSFDQWVDEAENLFESAVLRCARTILKKGKIALPLTAGLDSRHILGILVRNNLLPTSVLHICQDPFERGVVRDMVRYYDMDLIELPFPPLNVTEIARIWLENSGGLLNFHQFVFLALSYTHNKLGSENVLIDGYILGITLGSNHLPSRKYLDLSEEDMARYHFAFRPRYIKKSQLYALLGREKGAAILRNINRKILEYLTHDIGGDIRQRYNYFDYMTRGRFFTGPVMSLHKPVFEAVAPGVAYPMLQYIQKVPVKYLENQRLHRTMLKRFHPKIAAFGWNKTHLPVTEEIEFWRRAWIKVIKPGTRIAAGIANQAWIIDPMPSSSNHHIVRRNKGLNRLTLSLLKKSKMAEAGIIRQEAVDKMIGSHMRGAFNGWSILSLVGLEAAFRLYAMRESPTDIF